MKMHQTDPTSLDENAALEAVIHQIFPFKSVLDSLDELRTVELDRFFEALHIGLEGKHCECDLHQAETYDCVTLQANKRDCFSVLYFHRDAAQFAYESDWSGQFHRVLDYAIPNPSDGEFASRPDMLLVT